MPKQSLTRFLKPEAAADIRRQTVLGVGSIRFLTASTAIVL
jgi:hypothetical protein